MITQKKIIVFLLMLFFISSCTTTKEIMVPPLEKKPTVYDVYQAVLDTFQDLAIPVEFQDPPYSLESMWMYWPPHAANKVLGFPLTWWRYRAIVNEKTVILEAEGRGLSLTTLVFVNVLPAPVDWVAEALKNNLKSLDVNVETHVIP
ncbi:MAG: hypothetical protein LWW94_02100 [Candidatus Desulfofervidaceae bacterium]|nr:hypothetical protein [Candidatus Desulfofervidaceae bacterium]